MNKGLTFEEITHLSKTILNTVLLNQNDPIWKKAFELYNKDRDGLKKLGMGCRVCYSTVLYYFLQ